MTFGWREEERTRWFCGRENNTSSRWFLCVFVGNRGMNSGGTQMVRGGPLGRCGRTARPFSGSGVQLSGTFCDLSSQNGVYPAEMWPSSGGGRCWPIRWRPGGVANSETERCPTLFTKAPGIPDFGHWSRVYICLLYTSPSPRDLSTSRMPSSA